MGASISLGWCRDIAHARALSRLFEENLTSAYISHSELQGPRALAPDQWAPDVAGTIVSELTERVDNPNDAPEGGSTQLAGFLKVDAEDVGVFLVTFSRAAAVPFCILEDIVVESRLRAQGYGKHFLDWLYDQCRARQITRVFLESGINNHRAHELFKREGFGAVSVVMMKEF
jgi:GNAT superfamily N-acetyltransferase